MWVEHLKFILAFYKRRDSSILFACFAGKKNCCIRRVVDVKYLCFAHAPVIHPNELTRKIEKASTI